MFPSIQSLRLTAQPASMEIETGYCALPVKSVRHISPINPRKEGSPASSVWRPWLPKIISMNKRSIVRLTVAALLTFLLTAPLMAQEKAQAARQVTAEVNGRKVTIDVPPNLAPTEANFNQYKSDLLTILTAQKSTLVVMQIQSENIVGQVDSAIQQVQALEFSTLGENYPGFPDLTALKAAVTGQQQMMAQLMAKTQTKFAQFTPGDPFPPIKYASFCPLNPQPPEVAFTSGLLLQIARTVKEIAQDFCQQITEILGGGGNFALACLVTDIVYHAAIIIDYPIQACHGDTNLIAPGIIFDRLDYIHDQIDYSIANDNTNKALLSTQMTNAESHIVTNGNNNKAALGGQIGSFQTLATRMAIEANLAEDPATFAGAGLFEVPASQGGYLEVARQILIDTYNAHVAAAGAGVTIYNPSSELSLGATYTSQGKYREAYYYYRKAYRSVVKYP